MTLPPLREILEQVSQGALSLHDAEQRLNEYLRELPYEDLGFARVDHHRVLRQGFPEVILGTGKTAAHIAAIAARIVARGHSLLVTRTDETAYEAVRAEIPGVIFHPSARAITLQQKDITPGRGVVLVAAAGTADLPVAEEAIVTAELMGNQVERLFDVGVAGLHRLLSAHDRLTAARVIIVVAGMEGALPSVIGGLVNVPIIAVPTSIGYGTSFGGVAALLGMLNSCAGGISVVNIDNGFGAATIASLINHL
jgi:pyridinium-3,5-biscarboxylic acid mononucleotide synthase